jgi:uncharacterized membrane protein (DUF106 family)
MIMNEEIKTTQLGKAENGLSLEEQKWFGIWFAAIKKSQDQQIEILGKINSSLTFIVIIIILGIIITFFRGCTGT